MLILCRCGTWTIVCVVDWEILTVLFTCIGFGELAINVAKSYSSSTTSALIHIIRDTPFIDNFLRQNGLSEQLVFLTGLSLLRLTMQMHNKYHWIIADSIFDFAATVWRLSEADHTYLVGAMLN
ncbi:hypothetical protein K439DRAFT_458246 [Ramaria rubella]|nr:hypothetical protein K439DRAFT_458246 [Ramaria rubella]